ncbi:hypothetical protein LEP1GSC062_1957 [Leptospira alexanderi serovar Manhao 3 str. L 60]|uniref:Uncharacterized protein n=1 Tax=Leptospira alexanderi serovar Manhao 3 str. L 60 TaxID=1049759 RepID=V6HVI6_9LEPT|nr:hypothetical protein LEP1GSC062_1957 [Leptospira alexanderi serovar Manhao 3 str. L 60]
MFRFILNVILTKCENINFDRTLCRLLPAIHIRVVEKLILHLFPFYGNGQLKQFC